MNEQVQKEVEEIVSLMFPNQFLQRDMKKLQVIYVAGITKGLETAKQTLIKCESKTQNN